MRKENAAYPRYRGVGIAMISSHSSVILLVFINMKTEEFVIIDPLFLGN